MGNDSAPNRGPIGRALPHYCPSIIRKVKLLNRRCPTWWGELRALSVHNLSPIERIPPHPPVLDATAPWVPSQLRWIGCARCLAIAWQSTANIPRWFCQIVCTSLRSTVQCNQCHAILSNAVETLVGSSAVTSYLSHESVFWRWPEWISKKLLADQHY